MAGSLRRAGAGLVLPFGLWLLRPLGTRLVRPLGTRLLRPLGTRLLRPLGTWLRGRSRGPAQLARAAVVLLTFAVVVPLPAQPQPSSSASPVSLHLQSGTAQFTASATLGDFTGSTTQLRGAVTSSAGVTQASGWVTVRMDSLQTGNGRRDGHMREALEVEMFPEARFDLDSIRAADRATAGGSTSASTRASTSATANMSRLREAPGLEEVLRAPLLPGASQSVLLYGHFTVHGVRKPVSALGALQQASGGAWTLVALFPVTLAEHDISKGLSRMFGTIKVRPIVGVRLSATFVPR